MLRHFVPSRWLHPLAPLKRLSPVDLPSANDFNKSFAASKFEKLNTEKQTPDLVSLLNAYYTQRKAGAYSQKGKISNLKEMNETFNYLRANGIYTLEDLESRVNEHSSTTESLKKTLDGQTARMKEIKRLYDYSATFQSLKPIYDGLQKIKFEKPRAKYKAEHADELKMFYTARRKLTEEFPDGKVDMKKLSAEYDRLEQEHSTTYGEFKAVRDDLHRLWKVKSCVDTAARFNERTEQVRFCTLDLLLPIEGRTKQGESCMGANRCLCSPRIQFSAFSTTASRRKNISRVAASSNHSGLISAIWFSPTARTASRAASRWEMLLAQV